MILQAFKWCDVEEGESERMGTYQYNYLYQKAHVLFQQMWVPLKDGQVNVQPVYHLHNVLEYC